MPLAPNNFQTVYNIIRRRILLQFPDADFTEGSFNDIYAGAFALLYQELQAYSTDQFSKTFIDNPQTTGEDLENLAIDHYHEAVARPEATKSVGILQITRESDNTDVINITPANTFTSNSIVFNPVNSYEILGLVNTFSVEVVAVEPGVSGNFVASQEWTTDIAEVTVANSEAIVGGLNVLNDDEYRTYIHNYVESIQDGTGQGLEGTAKLVPGVTSARVIRKLVDVGTLNSAGRLETGSNLFKFKSVRLLLYISGRTRNSINTAVKNLVDTRVNNQLSAGEYMESIIATTVAVNWTVTLTFDGSNAEALSLSTNKTLLEDRFKSAIDDLDIGVNFNRSDIATKLLTSNGWTGYFTIVTNAPAGDVIISESEKAIAGDIVITVA